jgi:hypothetical protein
MGKFSLFLVVMGHFDLSLACLCCGNYCWFSMFIIGLRNEYQKMFLGSKVLLACKIDNLTAICELNGYKM